MPFAPLFTSLLHLLLLAVTSHCQTPPDTCEAANASASQQICADVSSIIQFTRFPNVLGHSRASDADAAIQSISNVASSTCHIDVRLFVCLYHFPTCRETSEHVPVVQPPCRDFCRRVETACAWEFSVSGIDCSVLPAFDPVEPTSCYDPYHLIVLNEVNVELFPHFVEFWDFGMKNTILDFFTVVFYASNGVSVQSFNLTEETTKMGGYITIGQLSDIDYNTVGETKAVALYRTNSLSPSTVDLVDALLYIEPPNAWVPTLLQTFPRLSGSSNTSFSRCYSLRSLTDEAYDVKEATIGAKNDCPQEEVQTIERGLEKFSINNSVDLFTKKCCFDTVIFCVFGKIDNEGYCVNRDRWMSHEEYLTYDIYKQRTQLCDFSAEVLAIAQSRMERDIIMNTCERVLSNERNLRFIQENGKHVQYITYGPRNEIPLIDSSLCQNYTENECSDIVARHFANNTDLVDSVAMCDSSQNYIGYTAGIACFGDANSPCSGKNSTWKAIVISKTSDYSDLRFRVGVLSNTSGLTCSKTNPCHVTSNSFVAFQKNDSVELINFDDETDFTFTISITSNESPFTFDTRGIELFEIRLLFNEKQKVAISPPVIRQDSPSTYIAFRIDPSAGTYTIIDRFE